MSDKSQEIKISELHKEIDLLQSCITRMASNSFYIKGWTITLVTAVLAFGDKFTELLYLCFILILPILAFWYLDAFFLQTERKYRNIYNWVIQNRPQDNSYLYDLNPHRAGIKPVSSILSIMFSKTLCPFYLIPILLLFFSIVLISGIKFCYFINLVNLGDSYGK